MIYTEFQGEKLSALGMGNMRLPVIDGDDAKIDVKAVEEMFACAMESGINYYDTAYGYHGGNPGKSRKSVLQKARVITSLAKITSQQIYTWML